MSRCPIFLTSVSTIALVAIVMLLAFAPAAQAGYPDGMNQYAAYHVMHGGLDPSGRIIVANKQLAPQLSAKSGLAVGQITWVASKVKKGRCEYSLKRGEKDTSSLDSHIPKGNLNSEIVARMIASPHKFYVKAGELENLDAHVKVRSAIVGRALSARQMDKKGLWKLGTRNILPGQGRLFDENGWVLPGRSLTEALYSPWKARSEMGCALAADFIVGAGIAEGRGMTHADLKKEVHHTNLPGSRWHGTMDIIGWAKNEKNMQYRGGSDIIPGCTVYVKNTRQKRAALNSGFNFVAVGGGKIICFGHDPIAIDKARAAYTPPDYKWSEELGYPTWGLEEPWK